MKGSSGALGVIHLVPCLSTSHEKCVGSSADEGCLPSSGRTGGPGGGGGGGCRSPATGIWSSGVPLLAKVSSP
eukprot:3571917-Lingulodinium_polyedra.AAC.1